jgi:hypothetical protein
MPANAMAMPAVAISMIPDENDVAEIVLWNTQ